MNPWENSRPSAGNLSDYLKFANLSTPQPKVSQIELQHEILSTMDNYYKLSSLIKEDQDSSKVGDFIDLDEIRMKITTLQKLKNYLQKVNQGYKIIVNKILENSPGNQIYVEHDFHAEFFKTIEVLKDKTLLNMLNQASKIHDATLTSLQRSLSKSFVNESERILESISSAKNQIDLLTSRFS